MLKQIISKTVILLALTACTSYAGTQIGATRVIYTEGKKETSVTVNNKDASPYLIKSWIENTNSLAGSYFVVTPPLFRMDGNQQNVVRIFKTNKPLPSDKETLFFLNITSIPSSSSEEGRNTLQIAVRTKMKLIYRPKALANNVPEDFADKINWVITGNTITATNPSSYYLNLTQITLDGKVIPMAEQNYLAPNSKTSWELPSRATKRGTLEWSVINDYGGKGKTHTITL